MVLLESNSANQNFFCIDEPRGNLYYNNWQWSITWFQQEIDVLRDSLDPKKIHKSIDFRKHWEHKRWQSVYQGVTGKKFTSKITHQVIDNIETVRHWLETHGKPCKTVYGSGYITVYTNDCELVEQTQQIAKTVCGTFFKLKKATLIYPPGTVVRKNNHPYQWRTYFRNQKISDNARKTLLNWVQNMSTNIHCSPSLMNFLENKKHYYRVQRHYFMENYYFLDHNDEKLTVWISMMCPQIIRKTMPIKIKDK